jgi:hypothetical protein
LEASRIDRLLPPRPQVCYVQMNDKRARFLLVEDDSDAGEVGDPTVLSSWVRTTVAQSPAEASALANTLVPNATYTGMGRKDKLGSELC